VAREWEACLRRPIRLAVVGLGKIAQEQHLPAIAREPSFELVAVVDPNVTLSGYESFTSIDRMLENGPAVDAVAICTPPQIRESVALQALRAGLHVLVEKPPAATLSAAMRIAETAMPGKSLFAAWHSREAPMVDRARRWIAGKEITGGFIRWREDARQWHPGQEWLWAPGGFGIFDPAINALSILTAITSERLSVREMHFEIPSNQHSPISARGAFVSAAGLIEIDLDFRESGHPSWEISLELADSSSLFLADGGARMALDGGAFETDVPNEYAGIYRRFAALIANGAVDFDLAPLQLVADAFLLASTSHCEAYHP
jgi:D-galactose 1-dehydrogenase